MPITVIELPHVGESVTEGIIGRWLKAPGERVEKYDALLEVVTDKVTMEVPSPYTGTLVKTLVDEGDTVPMGHPIAEMDVQGEAVRPSTGSGRTGMGSGRTGSPPSSIGRASAQSGEAAGPERVSGARSFEFMDAARSVGPTGSGEGGQGRPDALREMDREPGTVRSGGGVAGQSPPDRAGGRVAYRRGAGAEGRPFLSPLVRRLVGQHGVDVSGIRGSGLGGRITKDDVLRYVALRQAQGERKEGAIQGEQEEGAVRPSTGSGRTAEEHATAATAGERAAPGITKEDTIAIPLTPLRKTIAEHLTRSAREAPAAWTMVEADVSGLLRWRSGHREAFERSYGIPLTYLPAAAHVTAQALREHPRLNARWDADRILLHNRVHLGIAVSTEAGLIVPVVHDADTLSVGGLARRMAGLAEAARGGELTLEDVQGGTFTLNNTGALGSVVSVPIINPPQAAILTTEAIVKRPVVVEGDAIAVRAMMNLCLTFDHRVCDGADAAAFLQSIKSRLEAIDERTPLV